MTPTPKEAIGHSRFVAGDMSGLDAEVSLEPKKLVRGSFVDIKPYRQTNDCKNLPERGTNNEQFKTPFKD